MKYLGEKYSDEYLLHVSVHDLLGTGT